MPFSVFRIYVQQAIRVFVTRIAPGIDTRVQDYLHVAHFGRHARYIPPPLSPSQPVTADKEFFVGEWGTLPKFFAFFAFCGVLFSFFYRFSFFRCFVFPVTSTAVRFLFCAPKKSFFIFFFLSYFRYKCREDKARHQ